DDAPVFSTGIATICFIDPGAAARDFDPTAPSGHLLVVINQGSYPITFDSDGIAADIAANQWGFASYDGTTWNLKVIPTDAGASGDIDNLKLVRNAEANKLDFFTRSGGAAPDASNVISVAIPDGNGKVVRRRAAAYLSGTNQIVKADATGYWGYITLPGSQYPIYPYAIWDGTGIVFAASGCPTLEKVTTTTTATDPNYMLLENGSTYDRNAAHYCQLIGWFEAEYDTGNTPDWTIKADSCGVGTVAPRYLTDIGMTRIDFSGKAKPGEVEVNGDSLPLVSYARLYTFFGGAIYGAVDSSHFNLPNPRGRTLRIWDHGAAVDPDRASRTDRGDGTGGDVVGSKQADGIKAHAHTASGAYLTAAGGGPYGITNSAGYYYAYENAPSVGGNETRMINLNVGLFIRAY
ncbi:MAG TPA: hypothetical protein DCG53_13635, partial [Syntrophus sp. (in: bacteria)]|nr:hypothetical protein [Syntrophus sp. (in: bacteria)]